jgi:hypothetical protein
VSEQVLVDDNGGANALNNRSLGSNRLTGVSAGLLEDLTSLQLL